MPQSSESKPLPEIAKELTHAAGNIRWLRDVIKELHEGNTPQLADSILDVAAVLVLTPPLTGALARLAKALSEEARPKRTRTRKT